MRSTNQAKQFLLLHTCTFPVATNLLVTREQCLTFSDFVCRGPSSPSGWSNGRRCRRPRVQAQRERLLKVIGQPRSVLKTVFMEIYFRFYF